MGISYGASSYSITAVLFSMYLQNVFETSSSPISVAMENYRPPVETYDQVNVMTTEHNTDEVRPLAAEEDQCSARFPTAEYPRPE